MSSTRRVPPLRRPAPRAATSSQRVAVDDVVAAAALDEVAALAAEDDVAAGELGRVGAEQVAAARRCGRSARRSPARGPTWSAGVDAVAAEHVVVLPARQALDLVEAVADVVLVGRLQPGEVHVRVRRLRVALVGDPVEPEHALVALDPGAGDHDVVAALGVVVVVAAAADDDVVAGDRCRPGTGRRCRPAAGRPGRRPRSSRRPRCRRRCRRSRRRRSTSSPPPPKVSFGSAPPTTKSSPKPERMRSKPLPALIASSPSPPLMLSSPNRSVMMSSPSLPLSASLPAPPSMPVVAAVAPHGVVAVARPASCRRPRCRP